MAFGFNILNSTTNSSLFKASALVPCFEAITRQAESSVSARAATVSERLSGYIWLVIKAAWCWARGLKSASAQIKSWRLLGL